MALIILRLFRLMKGFKIFGVMTLLVLRWVYRKSVRLIFAYHGEVLIPFR